MKQTFWQPVTASLRPWIQLTKTALCMAVAGSAGFGFILRAPKLTPALSAVICGVFFLACGAASYNSLQEASADRLYIRTRNRPMAAGRLSERAAAWFSTLMVILGLALLWLGTENRQPLLLGLTALVLYNGAYTPLKKISILALFPGGLAGALPPLIGWTAAGGMLADYRAMMLFALFFLWQIPHFCLILLCHHEDYRTVEQPTLISLFSNQSLIRITLVWILAFIVVALAFTLDGSQLETGSRFAITCMAGILTIFSIQMLFTAPPQNYRFMLRLFNSSFFSTLLIVAILQLFAAR